MLHGFDMVRYLVFIHVIQSVNVWKHNVADLMFSLWWASDQLEQTWAVPDPELRVVSSFVHIIWIHQIALLVDLLKMSSTKTRHQSEPLLPRRTCKTETWKHHPPCICVLVRLVDHPWYRGSQKGFHVFLAAIPSFIKYSFLVTLLVISPQVVASNLAQQNTFTTVLAFLLTLLGSFAFLCKVIMICIWWIRSGHRL